MNITRRILIIGLFVFLGLINVSYVNAVSDDGFFDLKNTESKTQSIKIDEDFVNKNSKKVAEEINDYIINHPNLTLEDLQNDSEFELLAVQTVGDNGYTTVLDSKTGYFYFHPQSKLVNTDAHILKDSLPDWWKIVNQTIGPKCNDSSGYYDWKESDGIISKKYMALTCINTPTADNKNLFIASTAYFDKNIAQTYIDDYGVGNSFENSRLAIKQKAEDVAKQVEIYLKSNPTATVKDLQEDDYFQEIAVQPVGTNGYTSITDQDTSEQYFSHEANMVGKKISDIKDEIPQAWENFKKLFLGKCNNDEAYYSWTNPEGGIQDKYSYSVCVKVKTADGKRLGVDASIYVDRYEDESAIASNARLVSREVDEYLQAHPNLTIKDLQNDPVFWSIAVQNTNNNGYTGVVDSETGYFYFHPQSRLIDTDFNDLKESTPALWEIFDRTVGAECSYSSGYYDWIESDGELTKKFLVNSCVDTRTADGKSLFVFSSAYLNKNKALEYLDKYEVKKENGYISKENSESLDILIQKSKNIALDVEKSIDSNVRDVKYLSLFPSIKDLLAGTKKSGILSPDDSQKYDIPGMENKWQIVQDYFQNFYKQNSENIDMIRLFYRDGNIVNGIVSGENDLSDYKGDKKWFKDTMDNQITKIDDVYISSISIARRTNTPAIRYSMPIEIDNERLGLLVINFKADSIFNKFESIGNVLFLDKEYENAEGRITKGWVTVLDDSRKKNFQLSEKEDDASVIKPSDLEGDSGVIEFREDGELKKGAYQRINVKDRSWYVLSFLKESEIEKTEAVSSVNNNGSLFDGAKYAYVSLIGFIVIFLILFILYHFKILKLERGSLQIFLAVFLVFIGAMFIFAAEGSVKNLKKQFKESYIKEHIQLENILSEKFLVKVSSMENELTFLEKNIERENDDNKNDFRFLEEAYERNKVYLNSVMKTNKDSIVKYIYPPNQSVIGQDLSSRGVEKLKEMKSPVFSNAFDSTQGLLSIAIQQSLFKSGQFNGAIDFFVKVDDFFSTLSLFKEHIHPHDSFLLDNNGRIVASDHDEYIGKNILDIEKYSSFPDVLKDILNSNEDGSKDVMLEGKNSIIAYHPFRVMDNKMTMLIFGFEEGAYVGLDSASQSIWINALLALFLIIISFSAFSYYLNSSLKKEVDKKTAELRSTTEFIKEQLKKEEIISKEKESLLSEQKKDKKKLEEKITEMEKFNDLVVGRELKMVEMKKTIAELKKEKSKKKKV